MYELPVIRLGESTDARGVSFTVPEVLLSRLKAVKDVHIAEVRPGSVRGNHFHTKRTELIAVVAAEKWSVHWDTGWGTDTHSLVFEGGGYALFPPVGWSHAIKNIGSSSLWIFAASDIAFDSSSDSNDTERRPLV
ncbi:hypothetical protein [Nocardia asteroides]|uniref:polysaccharide biosynthesis C-terminal domain-containing protein n=1 Tax=Nocardia asteroides TaxID=1824 RepID=UPI001E45CBDC|nr:hypothetical protein [Nocardia asteroides]UGT63988.1 hypothetical protein LTT61_12060 [Nocardia asteroides]